ncbi:MAG: hypothetical protein NC184_07530 [Roseburia sp.]|nr:hypothetical protein [Roseburia sp.]
MVKKPNGRIIVYNRNVIRNGKPEYMVAKLTEHSWWLNDFVNAVCLETYESKEFRRIAWVGDYANTYLACFDLPSFNGLNKAQINRMHKRCWRDEKGIDVPTTDFTLDGLFLINKTKKEYVDCSKYYQNSVMDDEWCLHPLPLLTCIGNGLGGGDYNSPTDDSTDEYIGYCGTK